MSLSLYRLFGFSSARQIICLYFLVFAAVSSLPSASSAPPEDICHSEDCGKSSSSNADWALLQAAHRVARQSQPGTSNTTKLVQKVTKAGLNPSGAAAPLTEEGYSAVADRCCQAEMQEYIRRQMVVLDLEVCDEAGLLGMVPYHSCEKGPQTFAKLTSDLLSDSVLRCTWVAKTGGCKPIPEDCPTFAGVLPQADCGCSRSKAAKFDLDNAQVTQSNLGGAGPDSGAEEFRIDNAGVSDKGEPFDLVITAITPYFAKFPEYNGLYGFGAITIGPPDTDGTYYAGAPFSGIVDFKFSFFEAGTSTPLVLSEVHLAIFDLDGTSDAWGIETASSKGYKGYVTDTAPDITAARLPDGRTQFVGAGTANNLANPSSPQTLTPEQRRNSVMYFYADVSSFELSFGVEQAVEPPALNGFGRIVPEWGKGRYLFFAGESSLNDRCGD